MARAPRSAPATCGDLAALPDTVVGEIFDGSPLYAREGVRYAWLVSPGARTLEGYRNEGGCWLLLGSHSDDALVQAEPFEVIELDLLALWDEDRTT